MQRTYGPGADLRVEDLAISAGANLAFVSVVMSVCDPGEEVIIPVPWYFNQEQVLMMRGVRPVALRTRPEDGFVPQAKEAEKLVTQRTKAIALVSPNNPTGAIYPPALLARFALLCARHNIALILDETYRDFCPSSPHALFSQSLVPTLSESDASELRQELTKEEIEIASRWDWRKNLISLYSFSKSYAVPGHRLGAVVCGAELMQQVEKVLDCLQICPPRAIQLALAEQIPVLEPFVQEQAHTLAHRHAVLKSSLPSSWKLAAQGGFFAYLRHPFPSHSSYSVSQRLALELGVATLPGRFFQPEEGAEFWGSRERAREEDRWVRVGVANVDEDGVRGVGERLERAVSEWGWEVEK
ncbi:PLP-dependent transferase [Dacryopinax primogenitus]|uniref:PLP-dependent transferase n=1 Tax=Dacryopinax primogenitus (strain DJM 731) TaxID=1858805 RepID=M5FT35_DACPD|nr:PLP-dependent transferase [Dacryopinax primogenitus]EJU00716.1 PLP-dependent transferase [Dacryopinax primogenitus]